MKRFFLRTKNQWLVLSILILVSAPSTIAFLHPGFPQTDDGNWMIIRLSAFYETIRAGEFPVRWLSRLNNGYGYPVANFLYPGFMYLGVPITILTSSFVVTTKLLFVFSLIGSCLGMYLWLRGTFNQWSSFVGALVYLYSPYHLYDATVRGSLGEVLALAIIPYVFWAIDRRTTWLTGLLLGFFLISHNTLALLFLPIVITYQALVSGEGISSWQERWVGTILGVTLSSFFWIPALVDLGSTVFSEVTVSNWMEYFADFGLIGLVQIVVIGVGLFILILKKQNILRENKVVVFFILLAVATVFLSTHFSGLIWELLPVQFIQFPFRILSLTIFAVAFLCAWLLQLSNRSVLYGCFILLIAAVSAYPYITPSQYDYLEDGFYSTNQATTTIKNEYMSKGVKEAPVARSEIVTTQDALVSDLVHRGTTVSFIVNTKKTEQIQINQMYFPGWKVWIDNREVPVVRDNPNGVMEVVVGKGVHSVKASFEETPIRLGANLISLLSLALILWFLLKRLKI